MEYTIKGAEVVAVLDIAALINAGFQDVALMYIRNFLKRGPARSRRIGAVNTLAQMVRESGNVNFATLLEGLAK